MDRTMTDKKQISTAIRNIKNAGERDYLTDLMANMDRVVISTIPKNVASMKGDAGYAAGTMESTLATIRHKFSDYDSKLIPDLRMASVRDEAPGNRRFLINSGRAYASDDGRKALKGLVALASLDAAKRDGVKMPSH
jgi:hypothetical protein